MPMFHGWSRPKYFFAAAARRPLVMYVYHRSNALLQDTAKSVYHGVPGGSDSPWSLWYVTPCTVKAFGQVTGLFAETTPALISAVELITFIDEPGATAAVSAKSLKPALLAMARILPVDGWITTMALFLCIATALRAAFSADAVIVVARSGTLTGAVTTAWLLATALPAVVWIST